MSKIEEALKGNGLIYAIMAVLAGGGGVNVLSEGAEEAERDSVIQKFEDADYIQDTKYEALLALVNEMRIEIALTTQTLEQLKL